MTTTLPCRNIQTLQPLRKIVHCTRPNCETLYIIQLNLWRRARDIEGLMIWTKIHSYLRSNENVSPEDLAWVDSCLTEDFHIPEKDTEIPSSAVEINKKSSTYHVKHSLELSSTSDVNPLTLVVVSSFDENIDSEEMMTFHSSSLHRNPFRPTYNEDSKENETFDFETNLESSAYDAEHTSENIFKIWNLDVQPEKESPFRLSLTNVTVATSCVANELAKTIKKL
ncbi:hypothetical protein PIB30_070378 [Stylosanthes scabra]|uniref:Uncharacterized protein n=1 Tax=Stylosanthes scabra TaxID=79078 RepID=A0ABU6VQX6_9FABA|nr:hypothetical protein [Stylosanthes scabra]